MNKKFNALDIMNDKSQGEGNKETIAFKIDFIPLDKLKPSKKNKYKVDDVEALKNSIEDDGLQHNLTVCKIDGTDEFEILSGHRRFKALQELYAAGGEIYRTAPCKIIKTISEVDREIVMIQANATSRHLTDYERAWQAGRLKELFTQYKQEGFKIAGKKRDLVARHLNVSSAQVGKWESINNHLTPELMEEFKNESFGVTTAYELSLLTSEEQEAALAAIKDGKPLSPDDIKKTRKAKKTPPAPLTKPETQADDIMPGQINIYGEELAPAPMPEKPAPALPIPPPAEKVRADESGEKRQYSIESVKDFLNTDDSGEKLQKCLSCWCDSCAGFNDCIVEVEGFDIESNPCPCDGCHKEMRYAPIEKPPVCGRYIGNKQGGVLPAAPDETPEAEAKPPAAPEGSTIDPVKQALIEQTSKRLRGVVAAIRGEGIFDSADICAVCEFAAQILEGMIQYANGESD